MLGRMNHEGKHEEAHSNAREGFFDAQLALPHLAGRVATPLEAVIKRDGRHTAFDKTKIARAIMKAGEVSGGYDHDRAAHLASAVTIHLSKTVQDRLVTVDDIHAAVERVLIEMGHHTTATSFVRFREKRDRLRKLRLQQTPGSLDGHVQVQRSGETLEAWDQARIVHALVRETQMPRDAAEKIAGEVEQQIVAARVRAVTAPLVRELVTAKLLEHGLEAHARRHRRLGVPLFDTEAILCGPAGADSAHCTDPEGTDWLLAESVKKEYALTHVFSAEVAEAHLRGDIHIHGLSMVDRLHSASHSLELIKRFGMDILGKGGMAGPPKSLDVLSAEWSGVSMALQRHFYGPMQWRSANVFMAPFLEKRKQPDLRLWAEMTLRDLAMTAAVTARPMPPAGIELWWEAPPALAAAEAVGPGGAVLERTYRDYTYTIQKSATAVVDAFVDLRGRGVNLRSPVPVVRITQGLLRDPGYEQFLAHIAALAGSYPGTRVVFDRSEPWLVGEEHPWRSRDVVLHRVTINLPRAAYRGGIDGARAEIARLVPLAAAAHAHKHQLLSRILQHGEAGPLALIGRHREGVAVHELERAVCEIGVVGLNECAHHCTGQPLHQAADAPAFAAALLDALQEQCRYWSDYYDLRLRAAATADAAVIRRLAGLDLEQFPVKASGVLKTDPGTQEVEYTPGVECDRDAVPIPNDRVRLEGPFHGYLDGQHATRICVPDQDTSADAIAAFLLKTYHQTTVQQVVFHGQGGS
jgi:ribonucleoside-triphosphate reductase (formate)